MGLAFCLDAQSCLARVVVECDVCLSVLVQLQIGVPIERSAIVFLTLWEFVLAVVGMIEVLGNGIAIQDDKTVSVGDAFRFIWKSVKVYSY